MLVAYKSDFSLDSLRELVKILLYGKHVDERVVSQLTEDILECHKHGNLDNVTLNRLITRWNEKVRK